MIRWIKLRTRYATHVVGTEEMRNAYKIFVVISCRPILETKTQVAEQCCSSSKNKWSIGAWIGLIGLAYVSLWTFWFRKIRVIVWSAERASADQGAWRHNMQRAVSLRLQGGLKAVVWTDTLQQIIMMGSSIIVIGLGIIAVGGLDVMWQRSLEGDRIEFFKYVMTFSGPISNYWT